MENEEEYKLLNWRPWLSKRSRERPHIRWADDIKNEAGSDWKQLTNNRR